MAGPKTKRTDASVEKFIGGLKDERSVNIPSAKAACKSRGWTMWI